MKTQGLTEVHCFLGGLITPDGEQEMLRLIIPHPFLRTALIIFQTYDCDYIFRSTTICLRVAPGPRHTSRHTLGSFSKCSQFPSCALLAHIDPLGCS